MLKLLALDRFTILLFIMVILASFVPVSGQAAEVFSSITTIAIAILFFLHGAKLSREAVVEGLMHWKLHTLVFAFTFALFPIIGLLGQAGPGSVIGSGAVLGLPVYVLPAINSTVFDCLYFSGTG